MEVQSGLGLKSIKSQSCSGVGRLDLVLKDNSWKIGAAQWGGPEEAMPSGPVGSLFFGRKGSFCLGSIASL